MDEEKLEYVVEDLEDHVEFNKLYNYKDFRQLTRDILTYKLSKEETNELKNYFNWIVRNKRERYKIRFKWMKEHYLNNCECKKLSEDTLYMLSCQTWNTI